MASKTLISGCKRLGDTVPYDKRLVLNPRLELEDDRVAWWRVRDSIALMRETWANFPVEERKALIDHLQIAEVPTAYPDDDGHFSDYENWAWVVDLATFRIIEIASKGGNG